MYYIICSYVHNNYTHYIYIHVALTSKLSTVVHCIFPIYHTWYHVLFYIFLMLFIALENNAFISCLVKEHQLLYFILLLHRWQHPTTIMHQFCLCCAGKYSTGGWGLKASYGTWLHLVLHELLDLTPCAIFPYSTRTSALTNIIHI